MASLLIFLHLCSVLGLTGVTFYAFSSPDSSRRKIVLMLSGIFALLALISGMGLLHTLHLAFSGWIIVKLFCWLGIAMLGGKVFSKKEKAPLYTYISIGLILLAVVMVTFRPF